MHLLRKFLAGLLLTLTILLTALWAIPRQIDLDRYRSTLLDQVNRRIPGKLSAGHLELVLVPFLGLRVADITLESRDHPGPLPLARAEKMEIHLPLRQLFRREMGVFVAIPQVSLNLARNEEGYWNIQSFLRKTSQRPKNPSSPAPEANPTPQPKPSSVAGDVEALAQRMARGDFSPKGRRTAPAPRPSPVAPAPVLHPARSSLLGRLQLLEIRARVVETRFDEKPQTTAPLLWRDVSLRFAGGKWFLTALRSDPPLTSVGARLAKCTGAPGNSREFITAEVAPEKISVARWSLSRTGENWEGILSWDGRVHLEDSDSWMEGDASTFACGKRGQFR